MTLLKSIILLLICVFLGSCQNSQEDLNNHETQKKDVKSKKIDLKNLEEAFIDRILKQEIIADSLFQIFNQDTSLRNAQFSYEATKFNFDKDEENEIIIFFKNSHRKTNDSYLYILDEDNEKYSLSMDYLYFEDFYEDVLKIDIKNKIFFHKSRVHGTCDDGYIWSGYKRINNKLFEVVTLYGEHEGNSCGTYTEKDDAKKDFEIHSQLNSEFVFSDSNTVLSTCTFSEWIGDEYMDTWTEMRIKNKQIELKYVYNAKTQKFDCFNSRGEKLFEDGFLGLSFELGVLLEEGKL